MEREFLQWLEEQWQQQPGVRVGIGDDAAVVDLPAEYPLVVTTDLLLDGVHFQTGQHSPQQIGHKALGVNLSDLAAMAARPVAAVAAIAVPAGEEGGTLARALLAGMQPLAQQFGAPIIGGDTNVTSGPLTVAVTCFGMAPPQGSLLRSGAKPGDRILVTGTLGGSLLRKHLEFSPRVDEAQLLVSQYEIHAAMDISDGLSLDLSRMARQSGVGGIVEVSRVPISADAVEMSRTTPDRTPLERALGDGEDFELLLAVPPPVAEELIRHNPLACPLTDIGQFTAETSLLRRDADGRVESLPIVGYLHR